MARNKLSEFVKLKRKKLKLTQAELAEKAGIGLRLLREIEQGKKTMRMDKVNQVLALFGYELAPEKKDQGE
jgi:y4mF family transcriptional regulator